MVDSDGKLVPCLKPSSETTTVIKMSCSDVIENPYLFAQVDVSDAGVTIVTPGLKISPPKRCPYCHEMITPGDTLMCLNYDKISHTAGHFKTQSELLPIGKEYLTSLVDTYRIRSIIDIVNPILDDDLSSPYEDIVDETIAMMRLRSIITMTRLDDFLFLFCPQIGKPSAMQIAQACRGKLKNLLILLNDKDRYCASVKIPKKTADTFYAWVDNSIHSKFLIRTLSMPIGNMQ